MFIVAASESDKGLVYGEDSDFYVSVKSLTCLGLGQSENVGELFSEASRSFQIFLEEFNATITLRKIQRFGREATTKGCKVKSGDYGMVMYESQNKLAFEIVEKLVSKHTVNVWILQKRTAGNSQTFILVSTILMV